MKKLTANQLTTMLKSALNSLGQYDWYTAMMYYLGQNNSLPFSAALLAFVQEPLAVELGTAAYWKKRKVALKKLHPVSVLTMDKGGRITVQTVYASKRSGKPTGSPKQIYTTFMRWLKRNGAKVNIKKHVSRRRSAYGTVLGQYQHLDDQILLKQREVGVDLVTTLVHEAAHLILHGPPRRAVQKKRPEGEVASKSPVREIEADSTAYALLTTRMAARYKKEIRAIRPGMFVKGTRGSAKRKARTLAAVGERVRYTVAFFANDVLKERRARANPDELPSFEHVGMDPVAAAVLGEGE